MSLPSPTAPVPDLPNAEAHHVEASLIDSNDLTNREVRSDPILAALARRQGQSTGTPSRASSFKARPAPANMGDTTVGPRMTKAAALRQGLKWEETRRARPSTADAAVKPFGTKRSESTAVRKPACPSFFRNLHYSGVDDSPSSPLRRHLLRPARQSHRSSARVRSWPHKWLSSGILQRSWLRTRPRPRKRSCAGERASLSLRVSVLPQS